MTKIYDARNEFKPFRQLTQDQFLVKYGASRRSRPKKAYGAPSRGPNVRQQGTGLVQIKMAAGGTETCGTTSRKGNGIWYRRRDGACVSHTLA